MRYLTFILFLFVIASCTPVRYVNVHRPHTYRHRPNVYTVPVWVPGHGVILQQHHWRKPKPQKLSRKH